MYNSKSIFRLTQHVVRATRNASTEVPSSKFPRLKKLQNQFGVEDEIPVHLKGGFMDRLLFLTTAGLVTIGTTAGLHTAYKLIVKN
ncbi:cytochrome c oxidase subunit 7A2, mitochondrial-like [Anthonomus grandis grandis]|uniref:cytochrome c oxidase subunit 7A2, mitochondrial-like n=1 Tax=Anthonomus grandis grandis TaxID=2921223 RepID=UPI002166A48D|nr:cytochrome c oxidase subunit 7A2, mitochondrial-like [Anthonomus grandis grandis]